MVINTEFFNKYNKQAPRYTSYPPANMFNLNFNKSDLINSISKSDSKNISIYIHIPFCPQRCYFCGCNTSLYINDIQVERYFECLKKEILSIKEFIKNKPSINQIHFGGGTPNSVNLNLIREIFELLNINFNIEKDAEIAIECSPAYLDYKDIDFLKNIGFNRISLGIQDFNQEVLKAINRKPPLNEIDDIINYIRKSQFKGINIDLIYGLPLQTVDSFKQNILKAIELNTDRIVTFSYANIPWFNKEQNKMDGLKFPTEKEKFEMLDIAINLLTKNDYELIGMDHFAKKTDELAIAKKQNKLHRNFQGYCTKEKDTDVYAFGSSAISQLKYCYSQNTKQVDDYINQIESKGLAIERGYSLSSEDIIVKDIINEIMCNGIVNLLEICAKYKIEIEKLLSITKFDTSKIRNLIDDDLVEYSDYKIKVKNEGLLIVRNIAMAFDPKVSENTGNYSKII